MHDLPFVALVVALYWSVTRAARMASVIFRLLIAAALALLLFHGWL